MVKSLRHYNRVFHKARLDTSERSPFYVKQGTKSIVLGTKKFDYSDVCYLGKVIELSSVKNVLDYDVYIDISFPHVIGIFGSRGSGKSFDLGIVAEEINDPDNVSASSDDDTYTNDATIIFDVQDQFWTLSYKPTEELDEDKEQLALLKNWGLEPTSFENIEVWLPQASDAAVPYNDVFSIAANQLKHSDWLSLLELERFSPMGQALITLLKDISVPTPENLAKNCHNSGMLQYFATSTVDGLRWRLQSLEETGLITESGFNIDRFLQPSTISIILLRNSPDSIRSLIVGVFSRLISEKMTYFQQSKRVAIRKFESPIQTKFANKVWMLLDEAHVLVPSDKTTAATWPLIDYVKRGRDAGLSLVFATQQPSAVDSKLMSQVDLTITHTLGFESDINAAVARMPTRSSVNYSSQAINLYGANDVLRILQSGECIIADTGSERIIACCMRPRLTAHGGSTPK